MPSDTPKAGAPVGSPSEEGPDQEPRSRRNILKTLWAAAAGTVASGMLAPTRALAHGGLHQDFNGLDPAIHGNNTNGGPGVEGSSASGVGVVGRSSRSIGGVGVRGLVENSQDDSGRGVEGSAAAGFGVWGSSVVGSGVRGESDSGTGVAGESLGSGPGVFGNSDGGAGVVGRSHGGPGLDGFSDLGPGVLGTSEEGHAVRGHTVHGRGVVGEAEEDGIGVLAFSSHGPGVFTESLTGDSLYVVGRARFSNAGNGMIPTGQDGVFVPHSSVTPRSHITVTLTGNPGPVVTGSPAVVQWVRRRSGLGFDVNLTKKVTQGTPFSFLIVEPE